MSEPRFHEIGPFANLYEDWCSSYPAPRDPAIEQRLAQLCREAWAANAPFDREYILYFVLDHRDESLADLIVEGLRASDPAVTRVAATVASATQGRIFDIGPELRPAFRALVRRFPEHDTVRPRELFGHRDDDENDTEIHPFVNLYEEWRSADSPRDPAITKRLADSCRAAWETGDAIERAFVLHFLLTNSNPADLAHHVDGVDILRAAIATDDPVLAPTAAFAAWCYADSAPLADLGADFRDLLESHRDRFPERVQGLIWNALHALDKRERTI